MVRAPAIEVHGLRKSFPTGFLHLKRRQILTDLSFTVEAGEILGYLGPNGSGKTTTIKVLMGLVFADSGTIRILGHPLDDPAWRPRTGFLPEHPYFYDYLTSLEYLDYVGRLFRMPSSRRRERSQHLLELVGLDRHAHLALRRFSKGMLQRLGLAQALINDPELVILDEPMSGLDPMGRHLARTLILDLKRAGKTIFFSTHILSDAETLCDRVALIRSGRMIEMGALADILRVDVAHMEVFAANVGDDALKALSGIRDYRPVGERWRAEVEERALGQVIVGIEKAGGRILSVEPVRQSLEAHFVQEMGGEAKGRWDLPE